MLKWIRWSGLLGFAAVVALLAAFFLLAAGPLVKMAIEGVGSSAAGAKVNVDDVSLSLSPLGFELRHLTVANADKPMENLLEFESAVATVDLGPLLMGKGIIDELSVNTLRFNTARTTSGALEKSASSASGGDGAKQEPGMAEELISQLPSAEEILARESLQTEAAGKAFTETFDRRQQQLDSALNNVPDEAALKQYQAEITALTTEKITSLEDFNQRKQRLEVLREQFKADKKALNTAKDLIGETRVEVTQRLQDLKAAPGEDLASIRDKYQLNAQGAANLSGLLFGSQTGEWATQALYWYEKIKPYLASDNSDEEPEYQRPDGRYIHFPTSNPWPEFLIRHTAISAETDAGDLAISGTDLTHQQAVLGRPARIDIDGAGLDEVEALQLNIVIDHRQAVGRDTLTLAVTDWQLDSVNLGLGDAQLESAMGQLQGMAQITSGEGRDQLSSRLEGQFGQATFNSSGQTLFAKELALALASVEQFTIDARANGDLISPSLEFGSDIDQQLSAAFNQRLREQQDKLEATLQSKLDDKISEYAGPYADDLQALNNADGKVTDKLAQLEDMARAELDDYVAQQKQEAKDEASAKADEEASKLKEQAKDKLKSLF
ncbi:TIGR03545 family protein [Oceanobacter sp. 4_MG-2023]|uniref:TIGR03545 family protein n=1 Tax=Oceanobacter sp. 4_MG-2023 TaxID=3062623 RepID=UPI002732BDA5|nr:TIGR03545 family protein [Oceanobacter sp. 4_MG-2023]MDP2549433.1 TIGR03545 family protein [Oceanobacter sp. 4_MG-2023]